MAVPKLNWKLQINNHLKPQVFVFSLTINLKSVLWAVCPNKSELCSGDNSKGEVELPTGRLPLPGCDSMITVYSLCLLLGIFGWRQKVVRIQHVPQHLFFPGSPTRSSNWRRGTNLFCFHPNLCLANASASLCSPWKHPFAWVRSGDTCWYAGSG